ncbi:unnamed protein product, partial [Discosporangium mesarthrocarpum]
PRKAGGGGGGGGGGCAGGSEDISLNGVCGPPQAAAGTLGGPRARDLGEPMSRDDYDEEEAAVARPWRKPAFYDLSRRAVWAPGNALLGVPGVVAGEGDIVITALGWEEPDFSVSPEPLPGHVDPGSGTAPTPWCRWIVNSVACAAPKGKPGRSQLAGVRPGDELIIALGIRADLLGSTALRRLLSLKAWAER